MNTLKVEIVVPDWVNWITVDKEGEVWIWETKPKALSYIWDSSDWGGREERLYDAQKPKNWKDEIYEWK